MNDQIGNIPHQHDHSRGSRSGPSHSHHIIAESELPALSAETVQALFENAPDAMVVSNIEGIILHVNAETERIFGYQRGELIGEKVEKLVPERLRHSHEGHRDGFRAKPSYRAMSASPRIFGLTKDGTEIPLAISLNPVQAGEDVLLFSIIHDRTEWVIAKKYQREADFERTLSELSAKFLNLPPERVDLEITTGLKSVVEALNGDRASIALLQEDSRDFLASFSWAAPGVPEFPKQFVKDLFPWLNERVLSGKATLGRPHTLPPEAHRERTYMESMGIKASMIVPFRVGGQIIGGMSCGALREDPPWDDVTLSRFQAAADVIASALSRKHADEKLQSAYTEIRKLRDKLESENRFLREEIRLDQNHSAIVGESATLRTILKKAEQVACTDTTVLILGETGTGKELIARTIHEMSMRNQRPMVKTNCAALPPTLIESELFGREKGAYTGALAKEIGRFELADQSTIFLDEIGEIPPELQSKLLRILQDGQIERLGSSRTIHVDVRVIAATNRDLQAMVKEGKFREDLFYRLNVFPIRVPALRERTEDIPALVWYFLKELGERMGRNVEEVKASTMMAFQRYSWPGNIRELRNVIERNLILNPGPTFCIDAEEFDQGPNPVMRRLHEVEEEHFRKILETTKWRVRGNGGAAEILGLKPTTLEARLKKLNISRPH
jgi:PAS domain S-box-containing protein